MYITSRVSWTEINCINSFPSFYHDYDITQQQDIGSSNQKLDTKDDVEGSNSDLNGLAGKLERGEVQLIERYDSAVIELVASGKGVVIGPEGALSEIIKSDVERIMNQQLEKSLTSTPSSDSESVDESVEATEPSVVCRMALAPTKFLESFVSLGFRQGSPYIEPFDYV